MTNDPLGLSEETRCAHPDCKVILRTADGTIIRPGGACPDHQAWFALSIANLDSGDPAAIEIAIAFDPDGLHPEHVPDGDTTTTLPPTISADGSVPL